MHLVSARCDTPFGVSVAMQSQFFVGKNPQGSAIFNSGRSSTSGAGGFDILNLLNALAVPTALKRRLDKRFEY